MHFLAENRGCGRVKVGSLSGESGRVFRGQRDVLSDLVFCTWSETWEGNDKFANAAWALSERPRFAVERQSTRSREGRRFDGVSAIHGFSPIKIAMRTIT